MFVSGIHIYPIKSCRGVSVNAAEVQEIGLAHDRRYMVIDSDNRFVTQREVPAMAQITVAFAGAGWSLSRVNMPTLRWEPLAYGTELTARIWKDSVTVVDQGKDIADWFSEALGQTCRVVGFAPQVRRLVDPTYAVDATDAVSFADGYASLLVTEASLAELNTRTKEPVPMTRFRPNIVISGVETPWDEDNWREVRIGNVHMTAVKKCARCVMTTTDQLTGERRVEPLHTLATYRHIGHGLIFGQNMVHRSGGMIRVGDRVVLG